MIKKLLHNKKRITYVFLFVLGLVLIRFFEGRLFYDPFLTFFKTDFQNKSIPDYNFFKLFANLTLRFFLNSIFSLGLIYVLFQNKQILKLSIGLYLLFYVVLITLFFLEISFFNDFLLLFYTRRFLIQPILLILFIPAFYYQKKNQ